ncbi:MAG: glucan 1,4-alpha-glucosidase [Phycisphaerales bacterium]|nr:glucan 1,4-alpha-glucosidase [Phycisphaerales bacterium]MCB9854540.1 glucan 1,4-alpha-glucosidase [Phycisphaerales bacterium]MCB9863195.1 glucan 1,4-alpha-glucosidase [Phycisphaerales bacterium]
MSVEVCGWGQSNAGTPPGGPGIPPRWTSSAKCGVGTALERTSRVWFTLSHGILNEVYYPQIDRAAIRDLGLVVTDGRDFFSEEKRHASHAIEPIEPGVPAFRLTNSCVQRRYRIEKTVLSDPERDVVLQRVRFSPTQGELAGYHVYALLAPHLGNCGAGNDAFLDEFKGARYLGARRGDCVLALGCSAGWAHGSAGYVGDSDGWQDLWRNRILTKHYLRADNGNVALTGEVPLAECGGEFVLALGFGRTFEEAAHHVMSSLNKGFDSIQDEYVKSWRAWHIGHTPHAESGNRSVHLTRTSRTVLRCHASKQFPGAMIASLSIPWGFAKGDEDLGGYHLIWPRDHVEAAGGFLAIGAHDDALRAIQYLQSTQESDGHWPQNMWLDGRPYWNGVQMDETAFPILLVDLARREGALDARDEARLWPMIRAAAAFIARNGPVTGQDRWEEDPGFSPFTMAVEIAGLCAAAEVAERQCENAVATYLRETADAWEAAIDRVCYVRGTALARKHGVDGYYVRVAPPDCADASSPQSGFVPIKNRPPGEDLAPAQEIISTDALALVRFGLRAPDDPRVLNTIKLVDAMLGVDTAAGRLWRRYNGDGYGEHDDGSPFDGTGVGRAWPLLAGERGHYEIAAGRTDAAIAISRTLEAIAGESGLLPEQVWDAGDMPERELFNGWPSGSAMPLVWAHAEYLKLQRSLRDGRVFDAPRQTAERYLGGRSRGSRGFWRFNHRCRSMEVGSVLRIEALKPAVVRWSVDGWKSLRDSPMTDSTLGVHWVDLPTEELPAGARVSFSFRWQVDERWEGRDFEVVVNHADSAYTHTSELADVAKQPT